MDIRRTFDHEAILYNQARPHYPAELFSVLIGITGIKTDDKLLEIGPGTGQATVPLAKMGYHIVGIELGEHLAVVARHELSRYPNAEIITGAFEEVELEPHSFDLIYSATAFHWIKPEVRFTRTHDLLVPDGHLAIIHTNHVSHGVTDKFHSESQPIYDRYWPPKISNPAASHTIQPPEFDHTLFQQVHFQTFPLTIRYNAQQYADLLNTYSPILTLPAGKRQAFLREMRDLIESKFDGRYDKDFTMSLTLLQAI
jgi:SAM-dependent methyltransferase